MQSALEKFIRYAKIDTQSDENSTTYPSTQKQFDLLNLLVKELRDIGVKDAEIDQYGYVMGTVPGNLPSSHKAYGKVPRVGLVASAALALTGFFSRTPSHAIKKPVEARRQMSPDDPRSGGGTAEGGGTAGTGSRGAGGQGGYLAPKGL